MEEHRNATSGSNEENHRRLRARVLWEIGRIGGVAPWLAGSLPVRVVGVARAGYLRRSGVRLVSEVGSFPIHRRYQRGELHIPLTYFRANSFPGSVFELALKFGFGYSVT